MQKFTHRNDGFTCGHCGHAVPPATTTCRNHCTECLRSLHVDVFPGDRACSCHGLMHPIEPIIKQASIVGIVHQCSTCAHTQRNKTAEDDNRESLLRLVTRGKRE